MKKIIFILAIIFCIVACKKSADLGDNNKDTDFINSNGYIIGADPRMCVCCGGWFVEIDKDTFRIFNKLPEDFTSQLLNKQLPVPVNLDWRMDTTGCGSVMRDIIEVSAIKIR